MCRKKVRINQLKQPPSKEQKSKNKNQKNDEQIEEKKENKIKAKEDEIRFDSKLKRLMSELKRIRENNRNEKSLIFTSFSKSLDWICSELKQNGFEYRTLTGSMTMNKRKKQLDEFANNPSVDVFVLTVKTGSNGLNLTSANHVFMMEPTLNPALYRQAINRVYRLGQTKKVFVHSLIMKGSIEERLWNINKDKQTDSNNQKQQSNHNRNLAGNIAADKSSHFQQHEVAKLFEDEVAKEAEVQGVQMSDEYQVSVQKAERNIKRRLPIGCKTNTSKLVSEMQHKQLSEGVVNRALNIMHARGEIEYRARRGQVYRLK